MESKQYFKITYKGKFIYNLFACTKWEAIDKFYNENISQYPLIERQNLKATKL